MTVSAISPNGPQASVSQEAFHAFFSELAERNYLAPHLLDEIYESMSSVYDLIDRVLIASGKGVDNLKKVLSDVEQARLKQAFKAVEEQMKAQSSNVALKILKVVGFLLGLAFLAALPVNPVLLGIIMTVALTVFAGVLQEVVTGQSFIKDLMLKITQGNETAAHWLTFALEMALAAVAVGAAIFAAVPATASTAVTQAIKNTSARLSSVFGKPAEMFETLLKQVAESLRGLARIKVADARLSSKLAEFSDTAKHLVNTTLQKLKDKAPALYEDGFAFINALSIVSGVVMGFISIDKALAELRGAGIKLDLSLLEAVVETLEPMIKRSSDTTAQQFGHYGLVDECLDAVLDGYSGRN